MILQREFHSYSLQVGSYSSLIANKLCIIHINFLKRLTLLQLPYSKCNCLLTTVLRRHRVLLEIHCPISRWVWKIGVHGKLFQALDGNTDSLRCCSTSVTPLFRRNSNRISARIFIFLILGKTFADLIILLYKRSVLTLEKESIELYFRLKDTYSLNFKEIWYVFLSPKIWNIL
jgi:hypothetical protein